MPVKDPNLILKVSLNLILSEFKSILSVFLLSKNFLLKFELKFFIYISFGTISPPNLPLLGPKKIVLSANFNNSLL